MDIELRTKVPATKAHVKYAPDGFYTVVRYVDETWGCSCPHWLFRLRAVGQDCKHIQSVIMFPASYGYQPIDKASTVEVRSKVVTATPLVAKVKRYVNLHDNEL